MSGGCPARPGSAWPVRRSRRSGSADLAGPPTVEASGCAGPATAHRRSALASRAVRKWCLPSGIFLLSLSLKIEQKENKSKPPAEIMGFERKRKAGEGEARGGPKRVFGPDPVPDWGLMPESAG